MTNLEHVTILNEAFAWLRRILARTMTRPSLSTPISATPTSGAQSSNASTWTAREGEPREGRSAPGEGSPACCPAGRNRETEKAGL